MYLIYEAEWFNLLSQDTFGVYPLLDIQIDKVCNEDE